MSYSLNTTILNPLSEDKPKNAVILCHGYGGDGKDISLLANYWKSHLLGLGIAWARIGSNIPTELLDKNTNLLHKNRPLRLTKPKSQI